MPVFHLSPCFTLTLIKARAKRWLIGLWKGLKNQKTILRIEHCQFISNKEKKMFRFFKKKVAKKHTRDLQENTMAIEEGKNNTNQTSEEFLYFDHLNFKLAIIQVLMYEEELLKPAFDIFDFAEEFSDLEIDTENMEIIQPALEYFEKLQIPREYAKHVQEIDMDGGNEIYMNLIPQWDGEDETFDLNEVSVEELNQFPNLKEATIMTSNFDKVKAVFKESGIAVDLL
jgi:hypothetical protein